MFCWVEAILRSTSFSTSAGKLAEGLAILQRNAKYATP
jgi:hypothetical protein